MENYDEVLEFILTYVKNQGPLTYTEIRDAVIFKFFRETWDQAENVLSDVEHNKWIEVDERPSKSKTWSLKKI